MIGFDKFHAFFSSIGLSSFTSKLAELRARYFTHSICDRNGIKYALDLSELIDYYIYLGGWEPHTLNFLRKNLSNGSVVLEVGANVGSHTLLMAELVGPSGHIYAFEPTQKGSDKLLKNLELNPKLCGRVTLQRELVTCDDGDVPNDLIRASWKRGGWEQSRPERVSGKSVSLNRFAHDMDIKRVDLIKIDVDGYDLKVFKGSDHVIREFKPILFIELCEYTLKTQGDSVEEILELAKSLGYDLFLETGEPIIRLEDVLKRVGMNTSVNGVFFPRGKEVCW